MRWPVAAAVALCGCTLLFDPSRVPQPCGEEVVTAPGWLDGITGEAAGRVVWEWPALERGVDGGTFQYQLCVITDGGPGCVQVTDCALGLCRASSDGLPAAVPTTAELRAVDGCGNSSDAVTASASPFDATGGTGWFDSQFLCGAVTTSFSGGLITVDQSGGFCVSGRVTGDPSLSQYTLEVDLRGSASAPGLAAAVILHDTGTSRVNVASKVDPSDSSPLEVVETVSLRTVTVASATWPLTTDWQRLRVVVLPGVLSISGGPDGARIRELVRFADGATRRGRIGLGAAGEGRFDARNLRVHTRAVLPPDAGSMAATLRFDDPTDAVWRSSAAAPIIPCPALPSGCTGGCAPPPGARCAILGRPFAGFPFLSMEQPTGLDTAGSGYRVTARFAFPTDAGVMPTARILDLSSGESLLALEAAATTSLGTSVAPRLAPGTWHLATFELPPDGGAVVTIDGTSAPMRTAVPASPHPGALLVGGLFNTTELYLHELAIGPR